MYEIIKKTKRTSSDDRIEYGDLWRYFDGLTKCYRVVTWNERGYSECPRGICGYDSQADAIERWKAQVN